MWRPFTSKVSDKTYETFIKKHSRIISSIPKETNFNSSEHHFPYTRSLSMDRTLRYEEYKTLQSKVQKQRKYIQETENSHMKRIKTASIDFKEQQQREKMQKQEEMLRTRKFINNRTRKYQNLNLNPNRTLDSTETIFTSCPPSIREKVKLITKPNKIRSKGKSNYKEFQEKTLKELKSKAPNYYTDLHREFFKIREHCEMTYDQYKKSKRLKRTDPFEAIKKKKNCKQY